MLQEATSYTLLQHDEVHLQYADDAQGESQHSLLLPDEAGHVRICGETSHARAVPRYNLNYLTLSLRFTLTKDSFFTENEKKYSFCFNVFKNLL